MKTVLSLGGGIQTIAIVVMMAKGEIEADEVVFADTGVEKPETYWYIENYIEPMLKVPFIKVKSHLGTLYDHCWKQKLLPSVRTRWCTDKFKIRPIQKHYKGEQVEFLVGFSFDELDRTAKPSKMTRSFPLIERKLTVTDCVQIIKDFGLPVPLRSSCYFCVYEPYVEYNWLKNHHPELIEKALALEQRHYERYPQLRDNYGVLNGTPLWKIKDGLQPEMFQLRERSCWSGHCGH